MICLPKNQGRAAALPCPTESFAPGSQQNQAAVRRVNRRVLGVRRLIRSEITYLNVGRDSI
jgi:hypothetical protein